MKTKICTQCGQEKPVKDFYRIKNSNNTEAVYYRPACKSCCSEYKKTEKGLQELNKYRRSSKGRFVMLKATAKRRGIECALSLSEYEDVITSPCYYCSGVFAPPETVGYGLDRLDNEKGYVKNNVVSCCETCNSLKLDRFSAEETLVAVRAIIDFRKSKQ